jgi:gliding motility-associated-like protein
MNGSTLWVRTLTGDSGDDQVSNDVSMDFAGNLYITGHYQSEIHADPDTESSRGNEDVYVASYTIDGVYRWLKTAGSSNTDHGSGISGVYPGSVFVAGGYSSDLASFDAINLPADGNMNAFVGRLQLACVDAVGGTLSVSDTAVCEGEVLSLTINDHFGEIQWQSSPPGMNTWSQLRPDLSESLAFIPSVSADYRVLVTSGTCVPDSSNLIHVRVIPLPLADAGSDITINVGDSIQLNGSGGDSVRWDPDYRLSDPAIPDPFADPWMTTTYFLTAFVSNRCYATDSVIITVISCFDAVGGTLSVSDTAICEGEMLSLAITDHSGQIHWQYSPPGMNTWSQLRPDLSDSIALIPSLSADYRALLTSDTCEADSSNVIYVRIIPLPLVDAGNNITIDAGNTTQLSGSGGDSVRWDPDYRLSDPGIPDPFASPLATTTYYLTVMDSNGCSATDSVIVTVVPPDFAYAGEDTSICQGDSIRMQASGGDTYIWDPDGSLNQNDIPDPWASPQITTTYVVQVTDAVGLIDTDTVTVFVHFRPTVLAGEDISVCKGVDAQLSASGTGDFAWFPQGQVIDPGSSETMALVDTTTTFGVVLTDLNGCSSTAYITVFVVDPPHADAGPDQELTSRFESDLDASIGSGETGRWSVVSGYGVFTDPQSPSTGVMDLKIGENVFEWEVSNGVCPVVTDQVSIKVDDFIIPTVITPNEDGKNDLFHVENIENFTSSELVVVNRWGSEVYRSAPYLNNWGGTDHNMEALTEGTYYIILKITDADIRKGYVMILR